MNFTSRSLAHRLLWLVAIVCIALPLAAAARDRRMEPSERERLREELRDRYGEQRGREAPRGDFGNGSRSRFDAGGAEAMPRQRLSPDEMQVLRQQLRDQRERPRGESLERGGYERRRGGDDERGAFRRR